MEKILIIDDDEGLVHFLNRFFSRKGYEVKACTDGLAALDLISRESFDLILLDYKMPELNGLDTLKRIKESGVKTPVIIMTAYGTTETAIEAMKKGAYDYLLKPFDRKDLSRTIFDALIINRQMKEVVTFPQPANRAPKSAAKDALRIIGNCPAMQEVYKLIGQVAEKDVSVLISGESGTGKELVARAIYHHSLRRDRPFMAVNCAAIPDPLFESELFGYERGAFTGADRMHLGKLERCAGGTFFLDEIGDMSPSTQAKVLRVLQEGEFERLGGSETIKIDVRIIAATNKNLEKEVEAGRFREDLYWRLKIISLDLPELRRRTEDLPELVEYFVSRFSAEYSKPVRYVSDEAMKRILAYLWPGNVRELENCIRRAVLLCMGDVIIEMNLVLAELKKKGGGSGPDRDNLMDRFKDKLEELIPEILKSKKDNTYANIILMVEETLIRKALEECGNNQVQAANMLGISRNTLRNRIKNFTGTNQGQDLPQGIGGKNR
ncbi:sigma-54 dependent transcriptional regulator [Patescibacteria group bacterium]|nr:sigma-54 dependent transcriptional regulator [Patescibacteria group bacterium]